MTKLQRKRLILPSLAFASVMPLAACMTTAPGDAPGLEAVLGKTLIGVQGKTRADKEAISIRNARECAAGFWRGICP